VRVWGYGNLGIWGEGVFGKSGIGESGRKEVLFFIFDFLF